LDTTGLSAEWPAWEDPQLKPQATELATYNPAKARALLAKLGFTWQGGQLYDPKGQKVTIYMETDAQIPAYVLDAHDCDVVALSWYAKPATDLVLAGEFHFNRIHIRSSQAGHLNPALATWSLSRRMRTALSVLERFDV